MMSLLRLGWWAFPRGCESSEGRISAIGHISGVRSVPGTWSQINQKRQMIYAISTHQTCRSIILMDLIRKIMIRLDTSMEYRC